VFFDILKKFFGFLHISLNIVHTQNRSRKVNYYKIYIDSVFYMEKTELAARYQPLSRMMG
jgi:hypothetical protein